MSEKLILDGITYISAGDAAVSFNFTRDYVAKLCREGKVSAKRVGRSWYVDDDSLKQFLLKQTYSRKRRNNSLSEKRAREYKRARSVSAHVSIASQVSDVGDRISGVVMKHSGAIAGVAHRASSHVGLQEAALRAAHIPTYTVSPVGEMLHRIVALTTAIVFACGVYSFVDPAYARFAFAHMRDSLEGIGKAYEGLTSGGVAHVASYAQTALQWKAEDVGELSAAAGALLPDAVVSAAQYVNAEIDDFVSAFALLDGFIPAEETVSAEVLTHPSSIFDDERYTSHAELSPTSDQQPTVTLTQTIIQNHIVDPSRQGGAEAERIIEREPAHDLGEKVTALQESDSEQNETVQALEARIVSLESQIVDYAPTSNREATGD